MGTSAWNALCSGKKLWILFHPSTPKHFLTTSSLDTKTEKNFLKFISELKEFKLKIIVTHRKESLVICNEIFEMKLGALKRVI